MENVKKHSKRSKRTYEINRFHNEQVMKQGSVKLLIAIFNGKHKPILPVEVSQERT